MSGLRTQGCTPLQLVQQGNMGPNTLRNTSIIFVEKFMDIHYNELVMENE
jgi:hypothetical protein